MDNLDQFLLRPLALIIWIIASIALYKIASNRLRVPFVIFAMSCVVLDILSQLVTMNVLVMDENEYKRLYFTWGIFSMIDNVLIVYICKPYFINNKS